MARKIEDAFEELDQMIEKLEDRETSLEDSFQIYQEGIRLLKFCNEKIDTVEKKMMQMNEDGTLHEF
ncbi:MAG TPA: exodeoxyribonuclease VII small subunit [Candidatus Blautia avistercoris]|uniref:exodeoxyribonuclease VII small subunit n=1 Tax=Blautia sp. An249 TaxID=1965603 RepID=UPI000B398C88|nr:exodeoxyribonuclease VII small subunit [Blautia sp. An249]OUO81283.1 exodeoxyribonuclease VII small subunit [Blautia sp. An249]HIY19562.1 exodeoxyribonuclease VII small subunit [Candidatus Blautia avistercoris]